MRESYAVIAGGGTAGHLYPGLAVAEALISMGKTRTEIYFLTSDRDIDDQLLTAANFQFCLLYTSPSPRDKRQSRMPSSA